MADKVVSVTLRARTEGFTAGMRAARKSVDDLTKADVPKAAKGYSDLANKAALAGAAIAVGLGAAVKRFADFDNAMSAVRANSGATGAELEALRASAIKLGADSQFSATEAAQGVNELAKAGVRSADILGGGLKGSLDLAAAGQIEVAAAAETTASALTQFGLKGSDAVHVADLLASGANKAQGGVGDLGAALNQAGLVAASTGLSIEETAAGLTAFASAGLIGSDAGTSFKTMLQRLSAPSGEAATLMGQLGISAYDAQGNFVGLANVAGQLREGMDQLTPSQRNAAMATIFGSDAVRASNILYEQGAEGIRKWTEAVNDQGAAARQAAQLTDNFSGDVERLGGAFDSVLIQTGSGANASLRTLTQGLTGLVETVGEIPGPMLLAGAGLTAIALGVPKGISAFRSYKATLDSVGLSFDKIAARGPRAEKAIGGVTKATRGLGIAAAVLASAGVVDAIFGPDTTRDGSEVITRELLAADDAVTAFSARMKTFADESSNWWSSNQVTNYGDAIHDAFNSSKAQEVDNFAGSLLSVVGIGNNSDIANSNRALKDLDGALSGLVSSGSTQEADRLFRQFADAAGEQGVSVDQLKTKLPAYTNALAGVDNAQGNAVDSASTLSGATDDAKQSAEDAAKAWDDLKTAIDGLGSPVAQQRAAERDFQAAVDDASASIKENGKTLDEHTEKGRANQAALDEIRTATLDKVQADFELTGSTLDATKAMQEGRDAFIEAAVQAGYTKTEAKKLADQLGLIPTDVSILVSQTGAETTSATIDYAARDRTAVVTVTAQPDSSWSIFHPGGGAAPPSSWDVFHRAGGGPIWGPGTKTSDSIPLMGSDGEFMQRAAAVDKYGLSFMHAVNSLRFPAQLARLANGGPVQYAPPVQYLAGGGPVSHSTTNDSRFMADSVTIVTRDADSFKRQIRTAPYRAKSRPGR